MSGVPPVGEENVSPRFAEEVCAEGVAAEKRTSGKGLPLPTLPRSTREAHRSLRRRVADQNPTRFTAGISRDLSQNLARLSRQTRTSHRVRAPTLTDPKLLYHSLGLFCKSLSLSSKALDIILSPILPQSKYSL